MKRNLILIAGGLLFAATTAVSVLAEDVTPVLPETNSRAKLSDDDIGQNLESARLTSRVEKAKEVYQKLLLAPDGGIPEDLIKKSTCVAVLPDVLKAAFIAGGRFGKGIVSCKGVNDVWSPPAFYKLASGSIGFQIGAESTDFILFFMSEKAKRALLNTKFNLGADLGIAAGPVGRSATGGVDLDFTGIYSYARSQGLFAGVSIQGAMLEPDTDSNEAYYGKGVTVENILIDQSVSSVPTEAQAFLSILQ